MEAKSLLSDRGSDSTSDTATPASKMTQLALPGKPVAYVYGRLSIDCGLLLEHNAA